ncbi:proline-rich protein 5 isoform X1 [Macaca nemestrina]|uniref:Proline-rich protein 5 isoform 1 n=1 Tax=Macaca mulatta TaxID=9544 RepID=I0FT82_MACMU|nr:proline-rich protein 5 isoform X9 [Macaca fascicularis]XP_011710351.1 proline-rich protein 5 isoform X1 [Macaca nemestrina]XP_015006032.1 proline-rich protein 5 isoform X1 [Macaca mulatta]
MRTLRRFKFMSSPSLSDLGKREPAAAADERGTQQRRACANATWNSIHNGVIAVFQRKGLPDQELFSLNEGVRQLLKTELGSFFTEYLQNQLLTKGMVILRDKIRFYEGQKLLDSLAETWDFFFSDVLPMLQAIFYPVQGKEPSVRQLALLHFRNAITLSVKLEDALARAHARVPPAIVQMLLVLQGVHESRGVTEDYLRLEMLVQKVVSPYLGTYGLHSSEGPFTHSCILEKRLLRRSRSGDVLAKNPVVRSKSYNTPLLNPVQEHEAEGAAAGGPSIRRHSVSEMTSCPEPQGFSDPPGQGSAGAFRSSPAPHSGPCPSRLYPTTQPPEQGLDPTRSSLPHASPENLVDQILESVDSDSEGIFIDFGRGRGSGMSNLEGSGGRQSVV